MGKRFAVVLSGCGYLDGSEIHESVMSLYAIESQGASYQCFAPDVTQHHVSDHLTQETQNETRNVLTEAARIARGKIKPLSDFRAEDYDGLVFPGGYGAATSLSTFAIEGKTCSVNEAVTHAIQSMANAKKPIGALCISPVLLAKVLGKGEMTIGNDPEVSAGLRSMGATLKETSHGQVVIDKAFKLVTTPCYMLDATVVQIEEGATALIQSMLELM